MCGIAGWFVAPESAPDEQALQRVTRALRHRGPDDTGTFIAAAHGVALGHRRLSIIDLSSASHQPMLALDGQVALAYNGELYNFQELRRELEAAGERFATSGDTEVVLRAYLYWGVAAFARFAGMFALALWDARSGTLHLARDAMGIKPLYWLPFRGGIAFASEARALGALPGVVLTPRSAGVAQFLEFGYVIDEDETIFADVRKLAPGRRLEVRGGRVVATVDFFQPPRCDAADPTAADSLDTRIEQLHSTLGEVVAQHLIADVPVAMLLSGGIDSSVVAALAGRHTRVQTLTMAFEGAAVDERGPAREVATFIGAQHQEVFITADEVVTEVQQHAAMFDDLFADWGTVTSRLLYRRARELGYKVVLVGEGADELFGGYGVFDVATRLGPRDRFRLFQHYCGRRHGACWPLFRRVMGDYLDACDDAFDAVRLFESRRQLPNQYVMKVDKASMAESVEARAPYLDRRVAALGYAMPRSMLLAGGENKHALREMARRHALLPEAITRRAKYGSPLTASWMDESPMLRALARERLLAPGSMTERYGLKTAMTDYFVRGRIGQRWPRGISIYRNLAWKLLLLELWSEQVLSPAPQQAAAPITLTGASAPTPVAVDDTRVPGLVSTIIPVFNRASMLERAVRSVLAQTYRSIEIIIVDDGSTDDTPQRAAALAQQHPEVVRVVHQANAGPGVARQHGVDVARGEFVQYLDSDDRYLPEKTTVQVAALQADPGADIAYGKTWAVAPDGTRTVDAFHRTGERHRHLFPAILSGRIWPTNNPMYRARSLFRIGRWSSARQLEDWHYDALAGAAGLVLVPVDAFVAEVWYHDGEHLGRDWVRDPHAHRERVEGLLKIAALAALTGGPTEGPDMRQYCRTLFFEARLASQAGLTEEAQRLLAVAHGHARERRWELRLYGATARVLGWRTAGRLAAAWERGR